MESKYVNVREYYDVLYPYQFFVGGRGTGKTYSGLKMCIDMGNEGVIDKFIYMRRTDKELTAVMDSRLRGELINPFKSLNRDYGWEYGIVTAQKSLGQIVSRTWDEATGKCRIEGGVRGYAIALNTVSSIRGIDMTDADLLIYDEFIPERHVNRMRAEGEAFLNCIETISRNRELQGRPPMCVFCLANAFNIHNALFSELGVVDVVERMVNRRDYDYYDLQRGMAIHLLKNSDDFEREKRESSLYRLARGTRYVDMALGNDFIYNDFSLIGFKSVKGMRPVVRLDETTIWMKKGEEMYYCSMACGNCPRLDVSTEHERRYFLNYYGHGLRDAFIRGNVYFETYATKQYILSLLGILKD